MTSERIAPKRPRGRTPLISRDQIIQAAFTVGFERLTVQAVATHLGVGHAALYNHIRDRDDLIESAIRVAFADIVFVEAESWRAYLDGIFWNIWDVLQRYPGLPACMIGHGWVHPIVVHYDQVAVTLMDRYGFSPRDAILAVDTLHDFTDVPLLAEIPYNELVETDAGPVTRRLLGMRDWTLALDPRLHDPLLSILGGDPRAWVAVKLRVLFDGLERSLGTPDPSESGTIANDGRARPQRPEPQP